MVENNNMIETASLMFIQSCPTAYSNSSYRIDAAVNYPTAALSNTHHNNEA